MSAEIHIDRLRGGRWVLTGESRRAVAGEAFLWDNGNVAVWSGKRPTESQYRILRPATAEDEIAAQAEAADVLPAGCRAPALIRAGLCEEDARAVEAFARRLLEKSREGADDA